MEIRKAQPSDIDVLMEIYAKARVFMCNTGNAGQWVDGYPSREQIMRDMEESCSYVCVDNRGEVAAVFYFRIGDDPTYDVIYEGQWLDDGNYGVVHRLASSGKVKGVSDYCLRWCFEQCANVRIDTHKDNLIMQNVLRRNGYIRCGIILLRNGAERTAFQKNKP